jgi:hypothetical protein
MSAIAAPALRLRAGYGAGRRLRFRFADHRMAAQALERVEIRQVFPRFAGLHGDAANRAVAEAGARVRGQIPIRKNNNDRNSLPYSAAPGLIQINAGGPPLRRRPSPRAARKLI